MSEDVPCLIAKDNSAIADYKEPMAAMEKQINADIAIIDDKHAQFAIWVLRCKP